MNKYIVDKHGEIETSINGPLNTVKFIEHIEHKKKFILELMKQMCKYEEKQCPERAHIIAKSIIETQEELINSLEDHIIL